MSDDKKLPVSDPDAPVIDAHGVWVAATRWCAQLQFSSPKFYQNSGKMELGDRLVVTAYPTDQPPSDPIIWSKKA